MNTGPKYIAHVCKDEKTGDWRVHELGDHLRGVSVRAKKFANAFGEADWVGIAALWHDLGKYLPEWQSYIRRETGYDDGICFEGNGGRPNHSTVGAVFAFDRFQKYPTHARILGYIIAGHHAGLADWLPDFAGGDLVNRIFSDPLNQTLDSSELNRIKEIPEVTEFLSAKLPKSAPLGIKSSEEMAKRQEYLQLWVRMLFSCLVDADFLDTEAFMQPEKEAQRGTLPSLGNLSIRFDEYMMNKQSKIINTPINRYRNEVLEQCRNSACLPPGFFSLTVPTGGGKTLSAMAFALRHALKYNKQRIIMAIPYTSIIEQTAKVYKYGSDDEDKIKEVIQTGKFLFGEDEVLEHHSNIDLDTESSKSKLATENWDAPIIVTTNVQLFESLLASKTSTCRKLHNVANSVIILDEAQMLPPEYLKPILSVLKGLVDCFGVTVVLCTATQPTLCGKIGSEQAIFEGLSGVTEIISKPMELTKAFKRVEVELPDFSVRTEWAEIAGKLKEHEQVLCVVNTRRDCRDLHALMPEGTFHLSANMCGEERSEIIGRIKRQLREDKSIRVISTQLVEAGVDIDFPVVYRALAGVDSIAQAAGRCNREGTLNEKGNFGKVVVFQPPNPSPRGYLHKGESSAKTIFQSGQPFDFTSALYSKYFEQFYSSLNDFDKPKFDVRLVKEADEFKFQFRTFAKDVQLIDDTVQRGIVVYYRGKTTNSDTLINQLRENGPERWLMRKLQRFIVNVPIYLFNKLVKEGQIEEIHGYWVQKSSGLYRPGYGLLSEIHNWDDDLFIQ